MDHDLLDPFLRLLMDVSPSDVVRGAERDGSAPGLWTALQDSGFLDALVPEDKGGAGLSVEDITSLVIACGEYLVPAPVAETMVARALFARHHMALPVDVPILLLPRQGDGHMGSAIAPPFVKDCHALTQTDEGIVLVKAVEDERDGFGLSTAFIPDDAVTLATLEVQDFDLLNWAAAITSAYMAGAMNHVLALSIDHACARSQFGRPLSKFQAIQHHLAVMAEGVAAANAAARFALATDADVPNPWRVAVAKCMVNQSAPECCSLSHAIHGAIGISEEHDLQLYTRRIKRWQLSFGSEGYWARRVAMPWLSRSNDETSIDTIRQQS